MRSWRTVLVLVLILAATAAWANPYADIVVSTRDFTQVAISNTYVVMAPLGPARRTDGTNLILLTSRSQLTDASGVTVFSNSLWGAYQLSIPGSTPTVYRLDLGTNHSGWISAASLVTNVDTLPPNPATNYYTQAQIDALLAESGHGGAGIPKVDGQATNTSILYMAVPMWTFDTNTLYLSGFGMVDAVDYSGANGTYTWNENENAYTTLTPGVKVYNSLKTWYWTDGVLNLALVGTSEDAQWALLPASGWQASADTGDFSHRRADDFEWSAGSDALPGTQSRCATNFLGVVVFPSTNWLTMNRSFGVGVNIELGNSLEAVTAPSVVLGCTDSTNSGANNAVLASVQMDLHDQNTFAAACGKTRVAGRLGDTAALACELSVISNYSGCAFSANMINCTNLNQGNSAVLSTHGTYIDWSCNYLNVFGAGASYFTNCGGMVLVGVNVTNVLGGATILAGGRYTNIVNSVALGNNLRLANISNSVVLGEQMAINGGVNNSVTLGYGTNRIKFDTNGITHHGPMGEWISIVNYSTEANFGTIAGSTDWLGVPASHSAASVSARGMAPAYGPPEGVGWLGFTNSTDGFYAVSLSLSGDNSQTTADMVWAVQLMLGGDPLNNYAGGTLLGNPVTGWANAPVTFASPIYAVMSPQVVYLPANSRVNVVSKSLSGGTGVALYSVSLFAEKK